MTTITGGVDSSIIGIYLNKLKYFQILFCISGEKEEKRLMVSQN